MKLFEINPPITEIDLGDYSIRSKEVVEQFRSLKDIHSIFKNQSSYEKMDPNQVAYTVQYWLPVKEGTEGGLFWGTTNLHPGKVGGEYFMTKGHFHSNASRAEFYWGVQSKGALILMDENRNTWVEEMYPGSLHYIPGSVAHRVANIGDGILIFGACWPSDSGHDYASIAENGFSARLMEVDGKPVLIKEDEQETSFPSM